MNEKTRCTRYKKPLRFRGLRVFAYSPHLANMFRRNWHPSRLRRGLPGFIGPSPSTSLDESSYLLHMFGCLRTSLQLFVVYWADSNIVKAVMCPIPRS